MQGYPADPLPLRRSVTEETWKIARDAHAQAAHVRLEAAANPRQSSSFTSLLLIPVG